MGILKCQQMVGEDPKGTLGLWVAEDEKDFTLERFLRPDCIGTTGQHSKEREVKMPHASAGCTP